MSTLVSTEAFDRNLIGGDWLFPAKPYEYEIRSPVDSRILAVVPLSSRFDVTDAVEAARAALAGTWGERETRARLLHRFAGHLAAQELGIAQLQSEETGLSLADSLFAVRATLREARSLLRCEAWARAPRSGGVSGHILSWGLPFTEVVTSVLPALVGGDAVVIKPSLRAPLSAVMFGDIAAQAGIHPGVVNVVQGTGSDVGAELISRRDLSALHVRAGERTIGHAERARTGVPLHTVRAGGNVAIVGRGAMADFDQIPGTVSAMVRMNSAGGPFGLPVLAIHRSLAEPVIDGVVAALSTVVAAPLPTEPIRQRAIANVEAFIDAGARVLLGGTTVPDDIPHRMGWRLPPTVLDLGDSGSKAAAAYFARVPLGPVLGVVSFDQADSLSTMLAGPRAADGMARVWGMGAAVPSLPHSLVVEESRADDLTEGLRVPTAWTRTTR